MFHNERLIISIYIRKLIQVWYIYFASTLLYPPIQRPQNSGSLVTFYRGSQLQRAGAECQVTFHWSSPEAAVTERWWCETSWFLLGSCTEYLGKTQSNLLFKSLNFISFQVKVKVCVCMYYKRNDANYIYNVSWYLKLDLVEDIFLALSNYFDICKVFEILIFEILKFDCIYVQLTWYVHYHY